MREIVGQRSGGIPAARSKFGMERTGVYALYGFEPVLLSVPQLPHLYY